MSPKNQAKLRKLFDRIDADLCRLAGVESFGAAIKKLRAQLPDEGPSFAEWVHHRARREYPMSEPDSVDPKNFDTALALMENKEEFLAILSTFPDESAPQIEQALQWIHREFLPSRREAMPLVAKRLPRRPAGGRPKVTPGAEQRRQICKDLRELDEKGIKRGVAQRRVADRHSKALREIQRIWKECQEKRKAV